jgi:phospholipase D
MKFYVIILWVAIVNFSGSAWAQQGVLHDAAYTVCFTPGDQCTRLIDQTILSAKQSIEVQAYSFTSQSIIQSLIKAHKNGVDIFILLDKSNIGMPYTVIDALNKNKIPYLIDTQPEIAHNKVMIIDHDAVITGSFNFTKAAENFYAENVLVIHDKGLAEAYYTNFIKRKQASESIQNYCQPTTIINAQMCHQQEVLFQNLKQDNPWHRTFKRIRKP